MRAWPVQQAGEPGDVLVLAEVPDPEPGPGQVLVRVLGAAANFPDVLMCRGLYQVRPPYPFTPGIELCGVGSGAVQLGKAAGARVIGVAAAAEHIAAAVSWLHVGSVVHGPVTVHTQAGPATARVRSSRPVRSPIGTATRVISSPPPVAARLGASSA